VAGFGLPNFGQLTEAFRKAQQIQQDAQKLQDELDAMQLEGRSADGRAQVWLSGNQQPLKVVLDPGLLGEAPAAVEATVLEALEEQVVLLRLLGDFSAAADVTVRIGHENPIEAMETTSVVTTRSQHQDQSVASLGVVGPTHMDYASNIAAVQAVALYVSRILGGR
jgi:transcriptional regulator of heat shock response